MEHFIGEFAEPEVIQPHQTALKAFLVDLLAIGQQLTSMAEGSATLQAPFTQAQLSALQGVRSNAAFTRDTGYDQPGLLKEWLGRPHHHLQRVLWALWDCAGLSGQRQE